MAVVPFKRARRRFSTRCYLCTDEGWFRMPLRLSRALAEGAVAIPQFSNSIQRIVEVFVETEGAKISGVQIRPTHARFDREGKADLHSAVEAWALFIEGSSPKQLNEKVIDISSTLKARHLERGTEWNISVSVRRDILADIAGTAKLPIFKISK